MGKSVQAPPGPRTRTDPLVRRTTYFATKQAVNSSRRWIEDQLRGTAELPGMASDFSADTLDNMLLVYAELAANAQQHGRPAGAHAEDPGFFGVAVMCSTSHYVRVAVADLNADCGPGTSQPIGWQLPASRQVPEDEHLRLFEERLERPLSLGDDRERAQIEIDLQLASHTESGRGMLVVHALADAWGTELHERGVGGWCDRAHKVVWADWYVTPRRSLFADLIPA